jgi:hypothetical protein
MSVSIAIPIVSGQLTEADFRRQKPEAHAQKRTNGGRPSDMSSPGIPTASVVGAENHLTAVYDYFETQRAASPGAISIDAIPRRSLIRFAIHHAAHQRHPYEFRQAAGRRFRHVAQPQGAPHAGFIARNPGFSLCFPSIQPVLSVDQAFSIYDHG